MLTYRFAGTDNEDIQDDDFVIRARPSGPDEVSQGGKVIGEWPSDEQGIHNMLTAIKGEMELQGYWPNVWYINERGAVDLCVIVTEDQDGEAPGDFPDADASTMPATDGCADLGGDDR